MDEYWKNRLKELEHKDESPEDNSPEEKLSPGKNEPLQENHKKELPPKDIEDQEIEPVKRDKDGDPIDPDEDDDEDDMEIKDKISALERFVTEMAKENNTLKFQLEEKKRLEEEKEKLKPPEIKSTTPELKVCPSCKEKSLTQRFFQCPICDERELKPGELRKCNNKKIIKDNEKNIRSNYEELKGLNDDIDELYELRKRRPHLIEEILPSIIKEKINSEKSEVPLSREQIVMNKVNEIKSMKNEIGYHKEDLKNIF